jgi:hypothetical protein
MLRWQMNIQFSICIRPKTETLAPEIRRPINRPFALRCLETPAEDLVQMMMEWNVALRSKPAWSRGLSGLKAVRELVYRTSILNKATCHPEPEGRRIGSAAVSSAKGMVLSDGEQQR